MPKVGQELHCSSAKFRDGLQTSVGSTNERNTLSFGKEKVSTQPVLRMKY